MGCLTTVCFRNRLDTLIPTPTWFKCASADNNYRFQESLQSLSFLSQHSGNGVQSYGPQSILKY